MLKPMQSILREDRDMDYKPYIQVANAVHSKIEEAVAKVSELGVPDAEPPAAAGAVRDSALTPISESPVAGSSSND